MKTAPSLIGAIRRVALALAVAMALPVAAEATSTPKAERELVKGWALNVPATWEVQRQFMGVDAMARPDQRTDPTGWGQDLLIVARQPRPAGQTLDRAAEASLKAVGHHATELRLIERRTVRQGQRQGRWIHLRMKDGPEPREGQLLVLHEANRVVTVLATTSPERHARQQADMSRMLGIVAP